MGTIRNLLHTEMEEKHCYIHNDADSQNNILLYATISIAIAIALGVMYLPNHWRLPILMLLFIAVIIGQILYIGTWKSRKQKAGTFLFYVGTNRKLMLINYFISISSAFAAMMTLLGIVYFQLNLFIQSISFLFLLSFCAFNFFLARHASLEIYENGILVSGNFIPWSQVETIYWLHEKHFYLVGTRRNSLPFFNQLFYWPVNPSSKEALDIVLQRKFTQLNNPQKTKLHVV